jgi:hypothetical protein
MTPADDRLTALFAQDEPPARDPGFSAEVMERLARRQWLQDMAFLGGVSGVGALALWGAWPVLQPALIALSGQLAPAALGLAVALSAVAMLRGQVFQTPPMES